MNEFEATLVGFVASEPHLAKYKGPFGTFRLSLLDPDLAPKSIWIRGEGLQPSNGRRGHSRQIDMLKARIARMEKEKD